MIKINLLGPRTRQRPVPRPESTIGLSRRSVEQWVRGHLGGITDPRLFSIQLVLPAGDLQRLKHDLLAALRSEKRFAEADLGLLETAFNLMVRFHGEETFPSGEKVVIHLINVAKTVLSWGGDLRLAAAALLHRLPKAELVKENIAPDIQALIASKQALEKQLFIPLEEACFRDREARYVAKLCLIQEGNPDIWLLTAADCFRTLTSADKADAENKLVASRAYHSLPFGLRLFNLEKVAMQVEDIALLRLDKEEYDRMEMLLTDVNKMDRKKALEYLKVLTELLSQDLVDLGIGHRVEIDVKSVVSTKKKVARGDTLTDPARFRYIIDGPRELCQEITEFIIHEMTKYDYQVNWPEVKNYVDGISLGREVDKGRKPNGYESVHLHFIGPDNEPVMVQIRTEEMHEHAEIGPLSHGREFKLDGFINGRPLSSADETRLSLIAEGRRYGIINGKIYRLVPARPGDTPRLLDLAFAAGPRYGLHCPEFVEVERIDPRTGEMTKLRESAFAPLQNGDRISFAPTDKPIHSKSRLNKVATYSAMVVISLAQEDSLDEATGEERTSEAAGRGGVLLETMLAEEMSALRARMQSILRRDGAGSQKIATLYSIERAAKFVGLPNQHALQLAVALTREREQLLSNLREIIRTSSSAASYRTNASHADLWLLTYRLPGVISALTSLLRRAGLDLLSFESTPLSGNQSLVRMRVGSRKKAIEESLLSFLSLAQDLYQGLKLASPGIKQVPLKIEFSYASISTEMIHEISDFLHRQRANISRTSFPPVFEKKTTGSLAVRVPEQILDQFERKLKEEFKRFRRVSSLTITRV